MCFNGLFCKFPQITFTIAESSGQGVSHYNCKPTIFMGDTTSGIRIQMSTWAITGMPLHKLLKRTSSSVIKLFYLKRNNKLQRQTLLAKMNANSTVAQNQHSTRLGRHILPDRNPAICGLSLNHNWFLPVLSLPE